MFPQHFQTLFLTVLALVMVGYVSWNAAQPESQELAAPDLEPSKVAAAVATPVPSSVSPPVALSAPSPKGVSGRQMLPMPASDQDSRVAPEAQFPHTEHSPESLDYLNEIGFGVEYGDADQLLHKWTEDIRINVRGTPTRADLEALEEVVAELNGVLSDVHLQVTYGTGNLEIYFLPESQFASVEPAYVPVNLGFFRVWWDNTGAIHRARILIASRGITQQERSHLIREELTQSLGLFKDSWRYPDSVFYQGWTDINKYSDLDRTTVRLLYDSRLGPSMTPSEALDALGADSPALCCSD
jgi:hypothetical protein